MTFDGSEIDISVSFKEAENALHSAETFVNLIMEYVKKEDPQGRFTF
jgi:Tfp pilus assembly protein PilX